MPKMARQYDGGERRQPLIIKRESRAPAKAAASPKHSTNGNGPIGKSTRAISQPASIPGVLEDLRFCRNIELVHALGVRPLYELLAELGRDHMIRVPIEQIVERYAQWLDPTILRISRGDRFPPAPTRLLGSAR
jgi:hypothetical protein